MVVHGESGTGKSWLADTSPAPRLVLDAEGGARFTPSPKVYWDPMSGQEPPAYEGYSTVAIIRTYDALNRVYQWLNSGRHAFRSVVLDSITEIQKRCMDDITGTKQATQQDWGELLRHMEKLVRDFRDLTFHPIRPVEVVVITALTMVDKLQSRRPSVQGQLAISLPGFVDVVGYLYLGHVEGTASRLLLTQPYPGYIAKDRTGKLAETTINPTIDSMLEDIYAQPVLG